MSMKEKIAKCYERLQGMTMQMTRDNMEKMLKTLYELQEVYEELERMEADGNRAEADPGGRDHD